VAWGSGQCGRPHRETSCRAYNRPGSGHLKCVGWRGLKSRRCNGNPDAFHLRIDRWDDGDENVIEHLTGVGDHQIAMSRD
jgi:hypothetical protein